MRFDPDDPRGDKRGTVDGVVAHMNRDFAHICITANAIVCAVIVGLLGLAGCTRASSVAPPGGLQVDLPTSPTAIDPRIAADATSSRVAELIYDSLVRLDRNGEFAGDLAERIDRQSPNQLVFHLRHNVRFSDGRPFTARDVKFTYECDSRPGHAFTIKRSGLAELAAVTIAT